MKLWSGRISGSLDPSAAQLNSSLSIDNKMAEVDVQGSLAWAKGLAIAGILSEQEANEIQAGLERILSEFQQNVFIFQPSDEDIHTAVERRLIELIGPLGGKLHTGRSRNDQVATDFRLWLLQEISHLENEMSRLQIALVERAEKDWGAIIPGYTHFQQAQPILFSHWWLSHFWALQRDKNRLQEVRQITSSLPLGCGALAGTSFPVDRFFLANELGFDRPAPNSLDAISDRDFAVSFLFWAALTGVHLSRMAEALILYSTTEFGFVTLADAYSTGSSLMPQKRNADPLELVRGKSGILIGKLTGLLATLKGLPSAYDKDLQEDKLPVFEAAEIFELLLPVMRGLIQTLTIHPERTKSAIGWGMLATDLADYLVRKGIPFREAHTAVGTAVRKAEFLNTPLPKLDLEEWKNVHPAFEKDLYAVFEIQKSIEAHAAWGGTAPEMVRQQIQLARETLSK